MPTYTRREIEVAGLVSDGLTNEQVADNLGLSVNTIRYHLKETYAKLGTSSRAYLAAQFARGKIASAPPTSPRPR